MRRFVSGDTRLRTYTRYVCAPAFLAFCRHNRQKRFKAEEDVASVRQRRYSAVALMKSIYKKSPRRNNPAGELKEKVRNYRLIVNSSSNMESAVVMIFDAAE